MGERTANVQEMEIGPTLEGLARVIHERATERPEGSYTVRLLAECAGDKLLSKLAEESSEIIMACKDEDHDHIRYEMGDLLYHLLVVCEKYGVTLGELAGELDARRA
ncbi:phosphoribosyl-ATP diphosphatase [Olsenella intestinalis]|uniref:phosphoribosyl-ATP diphosphatase n=1 Tax=Olsenella intestinalis TaxID=2930083 RepID=UPI00200D9210|nr:phosphoribosyl-ATP diphosphatase [Olsenella intestinalis]